MALAEQANNPEMAEQFRQERVSRLEELERFRVLLTQAEAEAEAAKIQPARRRSDAEASDQRFAGARHAADSRAGAGQAPGGVRQQRRRLCGSAPAAKSPICSAKRRRVRKSSTSGSSKIPASSVSSPETHNSHCTGVAGRERGTDACGAGRSARNAAHSRQPTGVSRPLLQRPQIIWNSMLRPSCHSVAGNHHRQ